MVSSQRCITETSRNVLLDEGFDGADGEVDGVYDAEGLGSFMTVSFT